MKKIILSVMLAAASVFTYAQKGVMEIGGSFGINSYDLETLMEEEVGTDLNFNIAPNLMYYITDNIAVGGQIGVNYTKFTNDAKQTIFGIAPTVRYKKELGGNFYWAPQFAIDLGFGTTKFDNDDLEDQDIFGIEAGIHFARFEYEVSDKWIVSACFGELGYQSIDYDYAKDSKFFFNLVQNSSIGIAYKF